MSVYETRFRLLSADVDDRRRLRLSRLFTLLQEAAIAHTTLLGMGREKTLDRGLLWVITHTQARIARLPEYDEDVTLLSWPGDTMHTLFPRYTRLLDSTGAVLIEASALWALMDQETRKAVLPQEHGILIEGDPDFRSTLGLPVTPKTAPAEVSGAYTVPPSVLDLNGHMNNTRYLDLAEDLMGERLRARELSELACEFGVEARLGEEIALRRLEEDDALFLTGEKNQKRVFRMKFSFR